MISSPMFGELKQRIRGVYHPALSACQRLTAVYTLPQVGQAPIEAIEGTRSVILAGRPATELAVLSFSLVVQDGPERGKTATLQGASLTIGSDRSCDLMIADPSVSRRHAVLTSTPSGVLLEDVGSKNGTWLARARITKAYVPDGTILTIGRVPVRVEALPSRFVVLADTEEACLGMLGRSRPMREVFALVRQLARTDLPVAVTGETGTGKELVAQALHGGGPRRGKAFLVLDCGAVVADLLRSEIFGHEKGAFTGADQVRRGILEEAAGGTVLLDEIGEMELAVQPHLLRALETREICRLGSHRRISVDFRVVSATNRDLRSLAEAGRFREDLFYRLSCVTIHLPPLRERPEDAPVLAEAFVSACAARLGLTKPEISPDAVQALRAHAWPGNVRELRNVMEAVCVLSEGNSILGGDIERALASRLQVPDRVRSARTLEDAERDAVEAALRATGWNRTAAARRLAISPTTLLAKINRFGLKQPSPKG